MADVPFIYDREALAVNEAVKKAYSLIQEYSDSDPADVDSPWRHPQAICDTLSAARDEVQQAWQKLEQVLESKADQVKDHEDEQGKVRAAYMDMVTDAFADCLEDMRNGGEEIDVDVLVDCLQSGLDLMTQDEKEMLLWNEDDEDEQDLTPHERRRRELGFHVETAA